MSKIILLNPRGGAPKQANVPVHLLYLGTYLNHRGHEVRILDEICQDSAYCLSEIEKEAADAQVLGITAMSVQIHDGLRAARLAREVNPEIRVIWGGPHPTLYPEQTAEHPLVDCVVRKEGELTFGELIEAIETKKPWDSIPGITYRNGNGRNGGSKVVSTPDRPVVHPDDLPPTNWDLVDKDILARFKRREITFPMTGRRIDKSDQIPVHTSRGCPHRCSFCINVVTRNGWRGKSPEKVLAELDDLQERLGSFTIYFRDELFFVNRERTVGILKGMVDRDIRWVANVKADYFRRPQFDEEIWELAAASHCDRLLFGMEGGSENMLKLVVKDMKVDDIFNAARLLKKYQIQGTFSFMSAVPGERDDDITETLRAMWKVKKIHPNVLSVGPQLFRPYPGGGLFDAAVRAGYHVPETLDEWANKWFTGPKMALPHQGNQTGNLSTSASTTYKEAVDESDFCWIPPGRFDHLLYSWAMAKYGTTKFIRILIAALTNRRPIRQTALALSLFVLSRTRFLLGTYSNLNDIRFVVKTFQKLGVRW